MDTECLFLQTDSVQHMSVKLDANIEERRGMLMLTYRSRQTLH